MAEKEIITITISGGTTSGKTSIANYIKSLLETTKGFKVSYVDEYGGHERSLASNLNTIDIVKDRSRIVIEEKH